MKVQKAVLKPGPAPTAPKQLKGLGGSAWGAVDTTLKEFDVADKISDPSVHRYLHEAENAREHRPRLHDRQHPPAQPADAVRHDRLRRRQST